MRTIFLLPCLGFPCTLKGPHLFRRGFTVPNETWQIVAQILLIVAAVFVALIAHRVALLVARRLRGGSESFVVSRADRPLRLLLPLIAVLLVLPALDISNDLTEIVRRAIGLTIVGCFGWLLISLVAATEDIVVARYPLEATDNLEARAMRTRMRVMRNVSVGILSVLTAAIILTSFPSVRQLGVSVLASAGIIALVAGMAARPALANLIAGLQIAVTQPIRIDDVVVIEGEWGRIEEITSAYVVVRIWDSRRLIVPLSYIVEHHIENWTRHTSDLLGTAFVYTDYTVPTDEVRGELRAILESTDLWDGKVCALQVTNATERTLELRALMSSRNASEAFDLRCLVRERLVGYLQREHPGSLPVVRSLSMQDGPSSIRFAEAAAEH